MIFTKTRIWNLCGILFAGLFLAGCGMEGLLFDRQEKAQPPFAAQPVKKQEVHRVNPEASALVAEAAALWVSSAAHYGTRLPECSDPERAVMLLSQAIALDAEYGEAYRYRGLALMALGEKEAAFKELTKAIRLNPTARAYLSRGVYFLAAEEPQAALKDIEYALEKNPDSGMYWNYLGAAYGMLDDTQAMCQSLKTACDKGVCAVYQESVKSGACK